MYFDGGNVYSETTMQGPTYWTDGPYNNFIFDDFNFNTEDDLYPCYNYNEQKINYLMGLKQYRV
jgi:hypothetical protein